MTPHAGTGKRGLPAKPLADMVDRVVSRTNDHECALQCLGIAPRNLLDWRTKPGASVQPAVADRVISRSPYLWFDVWPECRTHRGPARTCEACWAHYRARAMFTTAVLPAVYRTPAKRRRPRAVSPPSPAVEIVRDECPSEHCDALLPWGTATCAECRAALADARRTLTEGMWADGWALAEMADVLRVGVTYFAGRRLRYGWDLPYRYERHATAVAA